MTKGRKPDTIKQERFDKEGPRIDVRSHVELDAEGRKHRFPEVYRDHLFAWVQQIAEDALQRGRRSGTPWLIALGNIGRALMVALDAPDAGSTTERLAGMHGAALTLLRQQGDNHLTTWRPSREPDLGAIPRRSPGKRGPKPKAGNPVAHGFEEVRRAVEAHCTVADPGDVFLEAVLVAQAVKKALPGVPSAQEGGRRMADRIAPLMREGLQKGCDAAALARAIIHAELVRSGWDPKAAHNAMPR